MPDTVWQAAPTAEIKDLAKEIHDALEILRPAINTGMVWKLENVEARLNHLVLQAPYYNEAAGLGVHPEEANR